MGQLSFNDLRRGMPAHGQRGRRSGMGDLGSNRGRARMLAAQNAAAIPAIRALQGTMDADIGKIRLLAEKIREMGYKIQDLAGSSDSPVILDMLDMATAASSGSKSDAANAGRLYDSFEAEFNSRKKAGGGTWAIPVKPMAQEAASKLSAIQAKLSRAASSMSSSLRRIQSVAKKAAQGAAASAAASAQQAASHREDVRMEREQREQERADQRRREDEAAQRRRDEAAQDRQYQAQLRQEEIDARSRETAREDSERARAAASDQARIDAEFRREEMAAAAEERQFAMEQERVLRAEEREMRREEREDALKRLVLMQELAASGISTGDTQAVGPQLPGPYTGFPGMPAPFVPAGSMNVPGMPGMFPMAPAAPATRGAVPYPAASGIPYAAQPPAAMPAFQQSSGMQVPGQSAPQGMAWASFNPANEMFGMGAMVPTHNPTMVGAGIDEEYSLHGSGDGPYQIRSSDGGVVTYRGKTSWTKGQLLMGSISDPARGKGVIFVPPTRADESDGDAALNQTIASGLFSTLTESARAAGSYLSAREQRRANKGQVSFREEVTYMPPGSARRGPSPLLVVGAIGAAAAVIGFAVKGMGKKSKKG